MFIILTVQ